MNKESKNIVILSHLFPPYNKIGAKRAYYFAKYLSELGMKVTVLSAELPKEYSKWEVDCSSFEVIRFNQTSKNVLPETLLTGKTGKIFRTFNFFLSPIESESRIDFNPSKVEEADIIFATGGPWQTFEYGALLKSKKPDAKLIFDYRDPWTITDPNVALNSLNNFGWGIIGNLKSKFLQKKEMKLLLNADAITSVTEAVLKNVDPLITKTTPSKVIFNGFDKNDCVESSIKKDELWITYTGILREEQEHSFFLEAVELLFTNSPDLVSKIKFNFIGSDHVRSKEIISRFKSHKFSSNFIITTFVSSKEAKLIQSRSDILLNFSYTGKKGIMSGKIFEYLAIKKPILLISNNIDVMEGLVKSTNTGQICSSPSKIEDTILSWYKEWENSGSIQYLPNKDEVNKYTYKVQAKRLYDFINTI